MVYRFLLDGMLGSLSRWLRIIGYDTLYYPDREDDDLRDEAEKTSRVLVTRDDELYRKALKNGVDAYLVKSETTQVQLKEIAEALCLKIHAQESRCPRCNGALKTVEKEKFMDIVPKASYEAYDEFWICTECSAVYWRGSHWTQIKETLNKIEG